MQYDVGNFILVQSISPLGGRCRSSHAAGKLCMASTRQPKPGYIQYVLIHT